MSKITSDNQKSKSFSELEEGLFEVLENYSNVHRGSGHNSKVTTKLYESARDTILDYLNLKKDKNVVIFCTPRRAEMIVRGMDPGRYKIVSSHEIGFPIGIRAIVVKKKALRKSIPFLSGGGTARLVSPGWVLWEGVPERFEAGTPSIINIIAFSRALILLKQSGKSSLMIENFEKFDAEQILKNDELNEYSGNELLVRLRNSLIGRDLQVQTTEGFQPYINFDNGASTRTFLPVWDAVRNTWRQSRQVQEKIIQGTRSIISGFLGAPLSDYEIIFTSNTTEAINLAAESLSLEAKNGTTVLNTNLEHNSNDLPWRNSNNISLVRINADKNGFIDLNELEKLLSDYNQKQIYGDKRISIVTISGASNVLGTFNNLEAIASIIHRHGARILVDAAQMVAHRKVNMNEYGIDYLVFSAHKVYAPFGTGVLIARKGLLRFSKEITEIINISGEENAGGIAGLGKSLLLLQRIGLDLIQEEERKLTEHALRKLAKVKGIKIYGIADPDSPEFKFKGGVISFTLKQKIAINVAKDLSESGGIGIRSGCHCAHILVKYLVGIPPFLEQFQRFLLRLFPKLNLPGVVRISFAIENSEKQIDIFVSKLEKID
jgi:selenocysteine lyase/cysteine desulfurase